MRCLLLARGGAMGRPPWAASCAAAQHAWSSLSCPRRLLPAAGPCALMTFHELCGVPVAAADYLALAQVRRAGTG